MTRFGQVVVCLLLAAGAVAAVWWIQRTEPTAQRGGATKETAMLVEVVPAELGDFEPEVVVLGTVEAEQDIHLRPRVSGWVKDRAKRFTPGGFVAEGETLLTLDPKDYEIAKESRKGALDQAAAETKQAEAEHARVKAELEQVRAERDQAKAELEQAEADLQLEEGRRIVAQRDYELLEEKLDEAQRRLALREPQLAAARARVTAVRTRIAAAEARILATKARIEAAAQSVKAASAKEAIASAEYEQAEEDYKRTTIVAPFDAQVLTRTADKGSQVSENDDLGRLLGIDAYWVVVTVPLDKLRWIRFPDPKDEDGKGSAVYIHNEAAWGKKRRRVGYVSRLIGALDRMTRLARVLVVVPDPLARTPDPDQPDRPPLIVASIVEARIQAERLGQVVRIERGLLRQGDTVWTMQDGKLDIKEVDVVFEDPEHVFIRSGLEAGTKVVVTNLATVAQDAPLRTAPAEADDPAGAGADAATGAPSR